MGGPVLGAGPAGWRLGRRGWIAAAERKQAGGWRVGSGTASGLRNGLRAMAASPGPAGGAAAGAVHGSGPFGLAFDSGLEIKTRSVEQTLLPLVSQVKRRARAAPASPSGRGPRWRRSLSRQGPGRAGGSRCPTFRARTPASVSDRLSAA